MIFELARILAAVYIEAERSKRRNGVYFGLHANITVRGHVKRLRH